jgi:beta-glucosidase
VPGFHIRKPEVWDNLGGGIKKFGGYMNRRIGQRILSGLVMTALTGWFLAAPPAQAFQYPFQDPDLGMEQRITNLLSLMSREEKIRCLSTVPDVPRLGVRGTGHVEGLHGLAMGDVGGWGGGAPVPTTQFPQAYGMGETWDPELVREVGAAEGREVRYLWETPRYRRGGLVVRAPNSDLARDPLWGRTEESFGEDPFLTGTLAVAMTKGLQGDNPRYFQCASLLKHFLSNSNEKDRVKSSSDYDLRLFHEYYSVPFRMAITEGKAQGMMTAYNAVNGTPCEVQPFLKKVVIGQWGHDGILCTDGGALNMLVTEHKKYKDLAEASAASVKAGINQFLDRHDKGVREALYKGLLTDAEMDEALRGVFRVMIRLGMLDPASRVPYRKVGLQAPWDSEKHKALALRAAKESVVLLRNEPLKKGAALLPVDASTLRSVAVIGPYADQVVADWYGGDAPYKVSPLDGIRKRLGDSVQVRFARDNKDGEAVKLAKNSDLVIVCVGNHPLGNGGWDKRDSTAEGKESLDRESMELRQEDLVRKVLSANPHTVVVVISSFPLTMEWTSSHAPAILHMTHSGQVSGTALAQAVFGDFSPAGHLTQTWPRTMSQLPPMMDYDLCHGRTYMYFKGTPLYPFGYGLSYSTFRYSNLRLSSPILKENGKIQISFDLANAGKRDADEVPQLYVRFLDSKVDRPFKMLRGFLRVSLKAGEAKTITFLLKGKDLAYWDGPVVVPFDGTEGGWKVEPGKIQVMVGGSSTDLPLQGDVDVMK